MSGSGFLAFLYDNAEVREMTRKAPIFVRSVIRASVMPSLKYYCSGSAERFSRGRTTIDGPPESPFASRRLQYRTDAATSSIAAQARALFCIGSPNRVRR